ncbi:MAG TPA: proline--tRNA ligase [Candidatus Nitrosocosmicus sp.]|nr:proline--tRNA ligase [Candidatus Nitrosocosmicus sp.]
MSELKEIGITTRKEVDFSEWYTQVVTKAGLIDYSPVKGFIVLKPYGYRIWEIITESLDKKLKESGHQNGFLPILIPESLLAKEKEHFNGFTPEVFWVTKAGDTNLTDKLAVRPTSETLAYQIFSKWIMSYRDLPLKMNFWNSALRAEIKSTKPFIRNSEFLWQEGHTVHENEKEAEEEVLLILNYYHYILENFLAIPTIKGSKTDKEKFVGALYTNTLESLMPDGKALQMATSHNLGQNFSKPFEIRFLGRDSKQYFAWQTSWGISWRVIGALIMIHGDNKGLILPPKIAPIQLVIVPIFKNKERDIVIEESKKLFVELNNVGLRVIIDDREGYTAGWKFNDWEVKGVPLRINIGLRDINNKNLELIRRDTGEKIIIQRETCNKSVQVYLHEIQKSLFEKAKNMHDNNIVKISNYAEMKKILNEKGGFILADWCEKEECENSIKNETGADIRLIPFEKYTSDNKCIYCNAPSKKTVIFAKSY